MTYKDHITAAMTMLGEDKDTCVVGYNTLYGKAAGTLNGFPEDRIFEMPLAENLMLGAAIGMSLDGRIPIVWVERADFLTCGMDAIVNHLNHIGKLSDGLHKPTCIIRVCVGNKKTPLFTGPTHTQDFTSAMKALVSFPVVSLWWSNKIEEEYAYALALAKQGTSTMLFEYKDQYGV